MGLVLAFVSYKASEDKERKCGSIDRAEHFLSNGEIFSLHTNFCTELEQFCRSPSAALACRWNNNKSLLTEPLLMGVKVDNQSETQTLFCTH